MPAISSPLQSQSNVTLSPISASKEWLPPNNLVIAAVAVAILLSVHLATKSRAKASFLARKRLVRRRAGSIGNSLSPEKSRGVSSTSDTFSMSANQPAELSRLMKEDESRGRQDEDASTWIISSGKGSSEDFSQDATKDEQRIPRHLKARPPPPPPLTPPSLSSGVYQFEDRRLSGAVSTMGDIDSSFIHQPNPDYHSSESSSTTAVSQEQDSPAIARRRSYTKAISVGAASSPIPISTETTMVSSPTFSPSSFPSSSPILPPAPHESFEAREVDVHGEIISVMDDHGAGWKRHTRVYGGGVCLACLASGGEHGGFYGARVRPEEKR